MSLLTKDFVLTGQNDKKVIFSRPYLNDERELMFLYCSEFANFPTIQFVLNEEKKAIELRKEGSKTVLILLRGANESFLTQALAAKEEILRDLRAYTQSLKTGKEKIVILETGLNECPYYFTSITALEKGLYSCKFEKGFIYFLNEQGKKKDPINDLMEIQKHLSKQFDKIKKDRFKVTKDGESFYEMTFGELYQIA